MKKFFSVLCAFAAAAGSLLAYELKVTSTAGKDGIAKCGEKVTLTAQAFKDGKALDDSLALHVVIKEDGKKARAVKLPASKKFSVDITLNEPGRAYIRCKLINSAAPKKSIPFRNPRNKNHKISLAGIGFFADPHLQRIKRQEPADFDKFWDGQKAELAKIPVKVLEMTPISVPTKFKDAFDAYDMKIACVGPRPVSGIITIPKDKKRKYPAFVQYHGAGIRSASSVYREGAITFNVNAHGVENRKPKAFYDAITKDPKRNFYKQGPDKTFDLFRFMFLRGLRALEYVRTLPEWNQKDLIVAGGSQGGAQTLAMAGLDKKVTLAVPSIPAMVGIAEYTVRKNVDTAWPSPYTGLYRQGKDITAIAKKFDYVDGAFFIRRITCAVHIAVGLFDTHAAHVYAAFNECPAKEKSLLGMPDMGHYSFNPNGAEAINKILKGAK